MALERHRPVNVERLELRRRFAKNLDGRFRWLANHRWLSPLALMRTAYRNFSLPTEKVDLIISAGGQTATANIVLARLYKVPNVFCGSHRNAKPENFARILIPYSDRADAANHVVLLKPSPVDPDKMRKPLSLTNDSQPKKLTGALLIGASTGEYSFSDEDWAQIIQVTEMGETTGLVDWLVTTSPRTPDKVADLFAEKARSSIALKEFVDFRTAGPGSIARLMEAADFIVSTEDSSSMVIEAICARRPTISLAPPKRSLREIEDKMLTELADRHWLARIDVEKDLNSKITSALRTLVPMTENHLEALAEAVESVLNID